MQAGGLVLAGPLPAPGPPGRRYVGFSALTLHPVHAHVVLDHALQHGLVVAAGEADGHPEDKLRPAGVRLADAVVFVNGRLDGPVRDQDVVAERPRALACRSAVGSSRSLDDCHQGFLGPLQGRGVTCTRAA